MIHDAGQGFRETSHHRRYLRFIGPLAAVVLLLSACAPAAGTPSETSPADKPTLEEAKKTVLSLERGILDSVPSGSQGSRFLNEKSSLMACQGGRKLWSGAGEVTLVGKPDKAAILATVKSDFGGKDGWTLTDKTDDDGQSTVDLLHRDGTHLIVGFSSRPDRLRVDAFSTCFDFPDYKYGEEY